jgi:hypothetical protein
MQLTSDGELMPLCWSPAEQIERRPFKTCFTTMGEHTSRHDAPRSALQQVGSHAWGLADLGSGRPAAPFGAKPTSQSQVKGASKSSMVGQVACTLVITDELQWPRALSSSEHSLRGCHSRTIVAAAAGRVHQHLCSQQPTDSRSWWHSWHAACHTQTRLSYSRLYTHAGSLQ